MKKTFSLILTLGFCMHFAFGQNNITGPIVQYPVYFDVSPPLRDIVKTALPKADNTWKDGIVNNHFNIHPKPSGQTPGGLSDPNLQTKNGLIITDTTIQNFDGNTNLQGVYPPDTYGEVGPNHYFQVVNMHYSIYSKTGTLLLGPLDNSSIFSGMPNNSNNGDAVVVYDEQADRWLFSQFSFPNGQYTSPYYQMIAVSQTADPTGSWYRYEYSFINMPDYPKFGVWGDGYYMSMNMFASGSSWAGTGAVAYNRSLMLAGSASSTMIMFTKPASDEASSWLPSDCDGPFPTGTPPNYFVYIYDGASTDHLGIYEFHVDWVTPANATFGNFLSFPVTAFTANITGIPQPGTTRKLDPLNDRLMYRLQYRKFSDHAAMVTNHTVDISSTVAGIRWYELRKTSSAWSIYQQATYSISDNNSRWMASMAMDTSGNIALGYSVSSGTLYPSIRYTGRMKTDALNTMTIAERGIYNGGGSQTGPAQRWGDYSGMSVDPSAPATFWYTQEYYATTSGTGWKTRIASFSFPSPLAVTATANPYTITLGSSSQLNVAATGGSSSYIYSWTSNPPGFTSNLQNPIVTPTVNTIYTANVTSGTQNASDTASVTVNLSTLAVIATATPTVICIGNNSQLNASATGGTLSYTYSWTSIPVGFTSSLQNPVVQPIVTTIYISSVNDGTSTATDSATVTVIPLPTASAGNDTTVCAYVGQIQLNGQSNNSSSVLWTTSGDGTFLNPSSLTAVYYPGASDKATLHVNLTLTASPVPPCTPQATSIRHITFDPCTGIPETGNDSFSVSIQPNPSFGTINLVISGLKTGEVRVSIMDLSGKTRLREFFTATGSKINRKVDLSTFQRGVYFVKVETDTQIKTEKLILE
jgi:hypothetical protein